MHYIQIFSVSLSILHNDYNQRTTESLDIIIVVQSMMKKGSFIDIKIRIKRELLFFDYNFQNVIPSMSQPFLSDSKNKMNRPREQNVSNSLCILLIPAMQGNTKFFPVFAKDYLICRQIFIVTPIKNRLESCDSIECIPLEAQHELNMDKKLYVMMKHKYRRDYYVDLDDIGMLFTKRGRKSLSKCATS